MKNKLLAIAVIFFSALICESASAQKTLSRACLSDVTNFGTPFSTPECGLGNGNLITFWVQIIDNTSAGITGWTATCTETLAGFVSGFSGSQSAPVRTCSSGAVCTLQTQSWVESFSAIVGTTTRRFSIVNSAATSISCSFAITGTIGATDRIIITGVTKP